MASYHYRTRIATLTCAKHGVRVSSSFREPVGRTPLLHYRTVAPEVYAMSKQVSQWSTKVAVCSLLLLMPASGRAANEVDNWNAVAANAGAAAGQHPAIQPRTYAIMHLAIHDALNAIDRRYSPYLLEQNIGRDAS